MSNTEHLTNIMVQEFIKAVEEGIDLVPVVADSTSTAKITPFVERYPEKLVNVGIAEQAMVSTAAGLSLGGKVAATCNAAPFLVSRANEQVKVDVCYNNCNVKLFGLNAGTSYGPLASTHHCLDDISIMRGFGNIEIYAPSCPIECSQIIAYAIRKVGPVYVRLDGKPLPELHDEHYQFIPGKIDTLRTGTDIAFIAMGSTVHEAVTAAQILLEQGISAAVISISSIRPCDTEMLAHMIKPFKQVISIEEHNVNGGVGSLVAEVIAEHAIGAKLLRLGIKDGEYAIAGDRSATRNYHGIDAAGIVASALKQQ